jgi:hypothetical protein
MPKQTNANISNIVPIFIVLTLVHFIKENYSFIFTVQKVENQLKSQKT